MTPDRSRRVSVPAVAALVVAAVGLIGLGSVAAGQNLVFHSKLGEMADVYTPTVGPPMVWPSPEGAGYVPANPVFDQGISDGAVALGSAIPPAGYSIGSSNRLFRLSNATGVVNAERGTVEAIFRILVQPGAQGTGWNYLHLVDGPYEEDPNPKFLVSVGGRFLSPGVYEGMRVYFGIRLPVGGTTVAPTSVVDGLTGALITGELQSWIKVTAIWDRSGLFGSGDTMRIYVNDVLAARASGNNWASSVGPSFDIGGCAAFGAGMYVYDDLKIWDGARLPTPNPVALCVYERGTTGDALVLTCFGEPLDQGFTAVTLDPANLGAGMGTGWAFGLHISIGDIIAQWNTGAEPFRYGFSSYGSHFAVVPGAHLLTLSGLTAHGIAMSIDPLTGYVRRVSPPTTFVIP